VRLKGGRAGFQMNSREEETASTGATCRTRRRGEGERCGEVEKGRGGTQSSWAASG